ncbi:MAG: HAMP domain-containing protein, partial [Candidatus Humimicrobiaceae bacterium]
MRNLTIRSKITIWYASLLLVLLVIFNVFIYMTISRILFQNTEDLLKADAHQVFLIVQSEGFNINFDIPYKIIATNTYFVIFDVKGNTGIKSEILPEIVNLPIGQQQFRNVAINKIGWIIYDTPVINNGEVVGWIRVSRSLQSLSNTLFNLRIIMFISIPLYGLLASAGGLFLAKRALHPIGYITKTAKEISKGDLTQRLKLNKTEDEVGRLAETFDEMLDKLENSIKKERQFASDASHELRTPIAIITAQTEEALAGRHGVQEYREAIETIRDESKKMSHIISQLLMIYRSDEGGYKFNFEILNLNVIIEDIV